MKETSSRSCLGLGLKPLCEGGLDLSASEDLDAIVPPCLEATWTWNRFHKGRRTEGHGAWLLCINAHECSQCKDDKDAGWLRLASCCFLTPYSHALPCRLTTSDRTSSASDRVEVLEFANRYIRNDTLPLGHMIASQGELGVLGGSAAFAPFVTRLVWLIKQLGAWGTIGLCDILGYF